MSPAPGGSAREAALAIFHAGLAAVDPGPAIRHRVRLGAAELTILPPPGRAADPPVRLPLSSSTRIRVLAIGKAASPMAAALSEVLGDHLFDGAGITTSGHPCRPARIPLAIGGHPIPDLATLQATAAMQETLGPSSPDDLVIVALSGGASSLMEDLPTGLALADLATTNALLLASGAPIDEVNTVRRHLSEVKGGRLAARLAPARVLLLAISDVPGDRLADLGSGPVSPDPTRFSDALSVLRSRDLLDRVPGAVRSRLESGAAGRLAENPGPGDPTFARVTPVVLASNRVAVEAAATEARRQGFAVTLDPEPLSGEAREAGLRLGRELRNRAGQARSSVRIAGGETTVTLLGPPGKGGRSQELALAAAMELDGAGGVAMLAAGTDGRDGPTDAAGGLVDGASLARGRALGLDARLAMTRHDAYPWLAATGDLLVTGATGTNVADLVVAVASGPDQGLGTQ